jgi:hypothetical protein
MNKEEMLFRLQRLGTRLGTERISKSMADADPDTPGSATYRRHFGSWTAAIEAAGLRTGNITGRPQDPPIHLIPEAMDIIEGELLGDASLDKAPTVNACFSHSTANLSYSSFLRCSLESCGVPLRKEETLAGRNGGKPQRRIRSPSNITFGQMRKTWYPEGKKIVPSGLFLNRIRCLFWYLGDGYIEQGACKFSTCGFSRQEVERLALMLSELGFPASRNSRSGGYHVVRIGKAHSQKFLDWIGHCPAKGYEHRWALGRGNR